MQKLKVPVAENPGLSKVSSLRPEERQKLAWFEGMSHAKTASPKSSFMTPWRMGDVVVGRENAGWTT